MPNAICTLCPFNCDLPDGKIGKCRVRGNVNGKIELLTYGLVTTAEVGPIEQKPLYHFHPGMSVLSIGGSGCNMFCGYCQNWEISQVRKNAENSTRLNPEDVVAMAKAKKVGGVTFTYSEPFVWYEYVMDVAAAVRKAGLKTILKTNGYANREAFGEMCLRMDAVNVDVKGTAELYKDVCGIELDKTNYYEWNVSWNLNTARAAGCHVEVSTLAIPGYMTADQPLQVDMLLNAIAAAAGPETPLHILKFIPDFKMLGTRSPSQKELDDYCNRARSKMRYVYVDFNLTPADTVCRCNTVLVRRLGIKMLENNLTKEGSCPECGIGHQFML